MEAWLSANPIDPSLISKMVLCEDMKFSSELISIIPVKNELGEGVLWRPSDQTIWWTDIVGKTLYSLTWGQTEPTTFDVPEKLCSFGFVESDEDCLIVAFETGFAYFWPGSGKVDWLCRPSELRYGDSTRLNDGRVGPDGAFWAGSMSEDSHDQAGAAQTGLYRLSKYGEAEMVVPGLAISNGLCWSPDGRQIYCSDSSKGEIYKADFDALTGTCGAFEVFAMPQKGGPDGAVTDSDGRYWSALWGGHRVACFDHTGSEVAALNMPVPQPTIPAFGGPDLDHMIIASAHTGLPDSVRVRFPQSGNLFIYKTSVTGCMPHYVVKS